MDRKLLLLSVLLILNIAFISSQIGGSYTYAFLNQTNSARVAALGGTSLALPDDDLNFPFHNPALLSSEMSNHIVLNYIGYFAGVKYGYASYARTVENVGNFAAGLHYVNYGEFSYANESGIRDGQFSASEYALNLIYSRKIDSLINIGINLKPVYSVFESYQSFGVAADIGISYYNPDMLFGAGIVMKNLGTQITSYYGTAEREKLPFEIQAGFSQKLAHAPFRFSLTFRHLQNWKLSSERKDNLYIDPLSEEGSRDNRIESFGDELLRHAIFGMEFMPGKNFYLALGYDYHRRQELKLSSRPGMVGFSWGFGMKISKFHFSYGRAIYHLAGASGHFSLSTNLSEFYHRKN